MLAKGNITRHPSHRCDMQFKLTGCPAAICLYIAMVGNWAYGAAVSLEAALPNFDWGLRSGLSVGTH